jgi:hypothetical protein
VVAANNNRLQPATSSLFVEGVLCTLRQPLGEDFMGAADAQAL